MMSVREMCGPLTFPTGVPHSIQALAEGPEFLLIFDSGEFNEDTTFLVTEMFLRNPIGVLSKNLKADVSAFDNLPDDERYVSPPLVSPGV